MPNARSVATYFHRGRRLRNSTFGVNTSRRLGSWGFTFTSRQLRAGLYRRALKLMLTLRVEDTDSAMCFGVRTRRVASFHFNRDDAP
jgi:predicted membrane GTPase involved in stress response